MPAPINTFKQALANGETVIGSWLSLGTVNTTELMGQMGFDWLLIDGEHGANDIRSIRDQLIALEASVSTPIVRVPTGLDWVLKQTLDVGAQTILVPLVETADQARALVRACRYPTSGIRGVGAAAARAGRFGGLPDYVTTANDQICVLGQVETVKGDENLDEILAVEGIDGVFIGPADLSADMGHLGNSKHPEAQKLICDALDRIAASGKPPGCLALDDETAELYLSHGTRFLAVGIDVQLLVSAARAKMSAWMR